MLKLFFSSKGDLTAHYQKNCFFSLSLHLINNTTNFIVEKNTYFWNGKQGKCVKHNWMMVIDDNPAFLTKSYAYLNAGNSEILIKIALTMLNKQCKFSP